VPQHVRSSLICALFAPRNCAHRGSVAESWPSATMSHCDESLSTVPRLRCLRILCHHGLWLLPPSTPFTGHLRGGGPPSPPGDSLRPQHAAATSHSAHLARPPHPHGAEIAPPRNARDASRPRPGRREYLSARAARASKQLNIALAARSTASASSLRPRLDLDSSFH